MRRERVGAPPGGAVWNGTEGEETHVGSRVYAAVLLCGLFCLAETPRPRRANVRQIRHSFSPRTALPPQDPQFRSVERESAVLPAGAALPPQAVPPAEAPVSVPAPPAATRTTSATAATATTAADAAMASPAGSTVAGTAAPALADTTTDTPAGSAGAAVQAEPALPGLRDLPADARAALPPLNMSMHVYAETPGERFVLIDGRRYSEGMALAPDLLLHEVRRDGVVLEFRGRRFLLPRPG